jgi:homoserine dehydrogenase
VKIALIGFGYVGQGFVQILCEQATALRKDEGLSVKIVSVATRSRGVVSHPEGLDPHMLLRAMEEGGLSHYPNTQGLIRDWDVMGIVTQSNADVVVELTHSNLETALPALDYVRAALQSRKHVVLANKGPVALAYSELQQLAQAQGVQLRFEATVMAGTPTVQLGLETLKSASVKRFRAILNGTTNYILSQMEAGISYADALADAQAQGYAEADPTADVGGWDAAGKLLILSSALFDHQLDLKTLPVEGITGLTQADVKAAGTEGTRYKLIAEADNQGGFVRPIRLSLADPLASVSGTTNAITFTTDRLGDVTLTGPGAGKQETGFAILADLLALHRTGSL